MMNIFNLLTSGVQNIFMKNTVDCEALYYTVRMYQFYKVCHGLPQGNAAVFTGLYRKII